MPKRKRAADAASKKAASALDGLVNYVQGMGGLHDPARYDQYVPEVGIDRTTADAIFRSSWLGRRVVTTLADDMVREWREVLWDGSQDEEDKGVFGVEQEEKRLRVRKRVHSAIKWARHYGGSLIVMIIKGQTDVKAMAEPLDVERIKKGDLLNLVVYDRWRVFATPPSQRVETSDVELLVPYLNQSFDDPNFGLPGAYWLADTSAQVHHTRCIRFDGEELPWQEWMKNAMWGDSVYKAMFRALKSYDGLMMGISQIVRKASVDVFSSEGLADLLASDGGTEKARLRYQTLSMMMSMHGIVAIDKDQETFERKPAQYAGLRDLCDRFSLDVAGAADVPVTRLFGQSPSGLNATGESDMQNYDNHIAARQESDLTAPMQQLDEVLIRSALGRMPPDYRFRWRPLRQMSDEQKSAIEGQRASRDSTYIKDKVITPGVAARELRSAGTYPNMTKADVTAAEAVKEPPVVVVPPKPAEAGEKPIEEPAEKGEVPEGAQPGT